VYLLNQNEGMESIWTPTRKRFIAFFDYLGFSNYVMRNSHEAVLKRMNKIKNHMNYLNSVNRPNAVTVFINDGKTHTFENYKAKATMFSDSFVIFTESDSKDDFLNLIHNSIEFIQDCIMDNIPIKGAISHGTLTADFENNI